MPIVTVSLPRWIACFAERDYIDLSLSRVLPMAVLIGYGVLVGLVFNTGLAHPWDKVQHLIFFALLTLAIHAFFCCRLRLSAGAAMALGILGEGIQALTPHHHASLLDVAANTVGVALVVGAVVLIRSETRAALADPTDAGVPQDQLSGEPFSAASCAPAPASVSSPASSS